MKSALATSRTKKKIGAFQKKKKKKKRTKFTNLDKILGATDDLELHAVGWGF
jgi:hypothetical protein